VRNRAQLTYNGVGPGTRRSADDGGASGELAAQLKLQDKTAQALCQERQRMGAMRFDRVETEAIIRDGKGQGMGTRQTNRAADLIGNREDIV
jgi:hypothetical protein